MSASQTRRRSNSTSSGRRSPSSQRRRMQIDLSPQRQVFSSPLLIENVISFSTRLGDCARMSLTCRTANCADFTSFFEEVSALDGPSVWRPGSRLKRRQIVKLMGMVTSGLQTGPRATLASRAAFGLGDSMRGGGDAEFNVRMLTKTGALALLATMFSSSATGDETEIRARWRPREAAGWAVCVALAGSSIVALEAADAVAGAGAVRSSAASLTAGRGLDEHVQLTSPSNQSNITTIATVENKILLEQLIRSARAAAERERIRAISALLLAGIEQTASAWRWRASPTIRPDLDVRRQSMRLLQILDKHRALDALLSYACEEHVGYSSYYSGGFSLPRAARSAAADAVRRVTADANPQVRNRVAGFLVRSLCPVTVGSNRSVQPAVLSTMASVSRALPNELAEAGAIDLLASSLIAAESILTSGYGQISTSNITFSETFIAAGDTRQRVLLVTADACRSLARIAKRSALRRMGARHGRAGRNLQVAVLTALTAPRLTRLVRILEHPEKFEPPSILKARLCAADDLAVLICNIVAGSDAHRTALAQAGALDALCHALRLRVAYPQRDATSIRAALRTLDLVPDPSLLTQNGPFLPASNERWSNSNNNTIHSSTAALLNDIEDRDDTNTANFGTNATASAGDAFYTFSDEESDDDDSFHEAVQADLDHTDASSSEDDEDSEESSESEEEDQSSQTNYDDEDDDSASSSSASSSASNSTPTSSSSERSSSSFKHEYPYLYFSEQSEEDEDSPEFPIAPPAQ